MMREETKKQFNQSIWSTVDLYKAVAYGVLLGLAVGLAVGYGLGLPDYSNYQPTYLKG